MSIDFFQPVVGGAKQNKNFLSVLAPFRKAERELFNRWAEGFIDRDGKLAKEFQLTFNSTFWEVYLFACLKEYGFEVDWEKSSPDFNVITNGSEIALEATTANSAQDKPNEWDRNFSPDQLEVLENLNELNAEAIIRLSNAIFSKLKKYKSTYQNLEHVKTKPFVLAVAPFEQPHFNFQYDRPIRALLYDYYVDEEAYLGGGSGLTVDIL